MESTTRAFIAAAALLVTFAASAQEPKAPAEIPIDRAAVSGHPQRIYTYYVLNPDCTVRGEAVFRVTSSPAHGEVHLEAGRDFPSFTRDNARFECNKQEVPVRTLFYQSKAGYSGPDTFVMEALYPDGHTYITRFRIDVWPEASIDSVRIK
jgi:hypothetical protein